MLVAIFILIPFLPAACLPLVLETFFSDAELDEMGVCLEKSVDTVSMQGYELVGFLPASNRYDAWEISEPLQTCQ